MAQHDNGRRPTGTQTGAWQQGHRDQQDFTSSQQEQSSSGDRYGNQVGGGQQGGHADAGSRSHQNQYDQGRQQQGDNWRERQGPAAGGWRPAMQERDRSRNERGGQGSFGGQASDNDYGNRGITESGNFGNYGGMAGQGRQGGGAYGQTYGQGGSHDQGGQSAQRFGGYGHGYDARSDSTGGYGNSDFGPDRAYGSASYGGGDWNAGSYGRGNDRHRGGDRTYGQSSADSYQGGRGWTGQADQAPSNRDRYGDNGYQSNWQQGQQGHAFHDPDYHQWRSEQLNKLDRDYDEWRQQRYQRFSEDFDKWRSERDASRAGQNDLGGTGSSTAGQQSGTSKHDISSTGDKGGSGKTASK